MRQIVLDTETTGLSWEKGNRVVEIGCIELINRRPTGRTYQQYLNPDREMEPGAAEVTGLTLDFLADKPRFAQIAETFMSFIAGAELVIHNAEFDVGFINSELSRLPGNIGRLEQHAKVLDTLKLAREQYPGQRNSLDALCKRLGVDNKHRQLHGALLDAELLTDVYLAMTSGQTGFGFEHASQPEAIASAADGSTLSFNGVSAVVVQATAVEQEIHAKRMAVIVAKSGKELWPG
jgi:DNA polymerase-3 subunit epsilon